MNLPRVGAKIRVTIRDIATGYTTIHEGTVADVFDVEFANGPVPHVAFDGTGGSGISLRPPCGYAGGWEELEPPKPTLPPEPPIGSVIRLTSSRTTNMGHLFERYEEAWFLAEDTSNVAYTWSALHEMGTVTPLVAVPDLAELVDALRMTANFWHLDHAGDLVLEDCTHADCTQHVALLAKYPSEVAS